MDLVLRALVAFVFVLLLTRVVGRRELASLQPFDLILLVMIGDLVQQGVTQNDFSITGMLLVGSTIGLLAVFVSWTSFRFPRLRPVLDGEPVVVVQDGEPIQKNLSRNRLTLDELRAAARQEQIASLADVQWAVLETSGRISFIPKERGAELASPGDELGSRPSRRVTSGRTRAIELPPNAHPAPCRGRPTTRPGSRGEGLLVRAGCSCVERVEDGVDRRALAHVVVTER